VASTPLNLSTQLNAVNAMLASTGEAPLQSLAPGQSSLADKAVMALAEASRSIQVVGWSWNKETNWQLEADDQGNAVLPANAIRVTRVYSSNGDILVQRGGRLYNRTQQTYTFGTSTNPAPQVDMVVYLEWDDLPEGAKQPIFYLATRRFQLRELTSTAIDAGVKEDYDGAIAALWASEDEAETPNVITDSNDLQGLFGYARRRPSY